MPDKKDIKKDAKSAKPEKKKRRSLIRVFRDTVSEGKKVTWPSREEWINHTIVVGVFVVLMMVIVGVINFGLTSLLQLIT